MMDRAEQAFAALENLEGLEMHNSEFFRDLANVFQSSFEALAQAQLVICLREEFSLGMTRKEKREQADARRTQLKALYLAAYRKQAKPNEGVAAMERLYQRFALEKPTEKTQFLEALGWAWREVETEAKAYQAELRRRKDDENLAFLRLLQFMGSVNTHLEKL